MRRFLAICLLLLGSAFLTQTVSASMSGYEHCCIADCGTADACGMAGCQPCGTPLMVAPDAPWLGVSRASMHTIGAGRQWVSWEAPVWRPPD
ncbi:hypothetical protein LJR066_003509 [Acidovorax sp. LjRoot66]|uniref:hypothetical protein n=1 Tax=Acidovorax sp. LjRoot66 TaxID=3342334 RepID=UPI003ECE47F2